MRYTKKPVTIEAVQFIATEPADPLRFDDVPSWLSTAFHDETITRKSGDVINGGDYDFLSIKTLEGDMLVSPDDFIIRGVEGELYPCKPEIFRKTYDPAAE